MKPKAYSYLRFSTPEQMKGDSFRRQTNLAAEYARRQGLILDDTLTYQDLGVSAFRGRNAETGRLADFLEAVRAGAVSRGSYLLVESLDRISRLATRKALRVLEEICEEGITVVTLADGRQYDETSLNDPTSLLIALLTFIRANEESETKSRRLKAAWQNKRAAGRPLTSICPAWLRLDKETQRFEVIEDRAEIVRRIFAMYEAGTGQHSIAEALNRDGVLTFGRAEHWQRSYVIKILTNRAVIGEYTPHLMDYVEGKKVRIPQDPIAHYFPAIVDPEAYDRVRALTATKSPRRGKHATAPVQNLLGGLARCPQCGSTMTRVNKGSGPKSGKTVLVCTKAKAGGGCSYRSVTQEHVERALLEDLPRLLLNPPAGDTGGDLDSAIESAEFVEGELQKRVGRLVHELETGGASATISKRIREAEADLEEASRYLEVLQEERAAITGRVYEKRAEDLYDVLAAYGPIHPALVNSLLRQVFESVTVDYLRGVLVLVWKRGVPGEDQGKVQSEVMYEWRD